MSARSTDRRPVVTVPGRNRNYEVGYGRPPAASRFKPGQSGNPRGRPSGSRNSTHPLNEERLKSIILDEAYRTISVNDVNGPITISMAQAVIRSLAVSAAKGSQRAQRLFTQLLAAVERDNKELHDRWLETAIDYKTQWERELERRKRIGIEAPDPVPHPDHVVIDMHTGTVRITGPMTKEEKIVWDLVQQGAPGLEEEIAKLEKTIANRPNMAIAERLGLPMPKPTEITTIRRIIVDPKQPKKDDAEKD